MPELLYVKCPACDTEQVSQIQFDRASWESASVSGNSQDCTSCGVPVLISKETAYFKG